MTEYLGLIILVVLGLVLILMGIVSKQRAKRTEAWPAAHGTILSSTVQKRTEYDSDSNHTSTKYKPVIQYQYSVMGQQITGKRLCCGSDTFGKKKAYEISARYPAGSPVNVRYNPEKVEESVLETSAPGSTTNIILGGVFIVLGIIVFLVM
jgi:hypothetical protein